MPMSYDFIRVHGPLRPGEAISPSFPITDRALFTTYDLTIPNAFVLAYMRNRWQAPARSQGWQIGTVVPIDGTYIREMYEAGIFGTPERQPLERWWESEVAALPEDIACHV